jgi:uroporphyrinogen-III synthase
VVEAPSAAIVQVPAEPDVAAVAAWSDRAHAFAFTSRNGVAAFVAQFGTAAQSRAGVVVAAVGQGTAEALAAAGVAVQVTAEGTSTGLSLANALHGALLPHRCIVAVQGRWARPELHERLIGLGHDVRLATVYENRVPDRPPLDTTLLADARTRVFVAAPSAVARLLGWYPQTAAWRWIAIGPTTAQALADQGIAAAALCPAADMATILQTVLADLGAPAAT